MLVYAIEYYNNNKDKFVIDRTGELSIDLNNKTNKAYDKFGIVLIAPAVNKDEAIEQAYKLICKENIDKNYKFKVNKGDPVQKIMNDSSTILKGLYDLSTGGLSVHGLEKHEAWKELQEKHNK